ncbi:hypothetical protein CVT25_015795 [Psilocybe cyanescens]|uniref:Cell cycle checkpoint control protein RAD9A n=1 Tax=Psilocybe cyanescens TaxID=93625 RepID=A0A409X1H9_PSICY|nr:hypothetical protein CVT25_015795 [Psilocybe cyanescens]
MQATLDAFSLKALTRALTCLSKYGDELSVYATSDFLSLSSTNSSKSAYCRFKYERQFFSRYKLTASDENVLGSEAEDNQNVTGQLMTKSFLSILKHRTVEKSVERCELSIVEGNADEGEGDEDRDSLESKLIVRLHCKHGVIKTHRLLLLIPMTLMVPGVPDNTNESRLIIGPKTLKDLLEHFPVAKGARSDPQLVWTFDNGEVSLKSMESSVDSRGRGQLSTEISITTQEFDIYELYEAPTTIAFHLREFTATIAFADSMSLPLEMRFTDPSAPLFIDIEGDLIEVLFVISTSHVPGVTAATQYNSQNINIKKRERAQSTAETPRVKRPMKAVQVMAPGIDYNKSNSNSRAGSHIDGSMPPPSVIPNRGSYSAMQSQNSGRSVKSPGPSSSHGQRLGPPQSVKKEPLFLPSSQMSAADEEVLRSTGLGLENMDSAELAELLEGEGEEVDFSYMSQQPPLASLSPEERTGGSDYDMQVDDQDSFELAGLSATQEEEDADKTFQPLFED